MLIEKLINSNKFIAPAGKKVSLKDFATKYEGKELSKKDAEMLLEEGRKQLAIMQDKLYAHNQYSVLIIFQAMDAAGKDGAVKHVMSGLNPLGVRVYSFKAPTAHELDHDYFWRHMQALPPRGEIAIHNRSHYENVLVTKVHPEYILNENLPGIDSIDKIDKKFWQIRYEQIRRFEKNLTENGMIILKFFLHVSKDEQKKRFLERIENPEKNWKFSASDVKERAFWDEYQKAFEEAFSETSTDYAPWFIIPADNKWFARLAIATIIYQQFEKLNLSYPTVSAKQKAALEEARKILLAEDEKKDKKNKK
ncbi:polyphosphate kinase 2 family protein [Raineya orbicola]|jgi:PPK2 family polyphosphate:nucleotide phosphotransferase|uniref:Polyphosphate:nucleotide phosphotransferase, PPK2 family n=1 Tax=Raineya orbicola TaxID=2016530 RepID=A0A2N3IBB3_9BACT|nr:polyphosphate kinase 2 family protein [Raineya orbicola]PKQ67622.1 Polyphosphate:nucleotide phosphotransferase, PPK2 family [Raineya orbicola]